MPTTIIVSIYARYASTPATPNFSQYQRIAMWTYCRAPGSPPRSAGNALARGWQAESDERLAPICAITFLRSSMR